MCKAASCHIYFCLNLPQFYVAGGKRVFHFSRNTNQNSQANYRLRRVQATESGAFTPWNGTIWVLFFVFLCKNTWIHTQTCTHTDTQNYFSQSNHEYAFSSWLTASKRERKKILTTKMVSISNCVVQGHCAEWRANHQWDIFFLDMGCVLIDSGNHCDHSDSGNHCDHWDFIDDHWEGKEELDLRLDHHLFVCKAQRGTEDSVDLLWNSSGNSAKASFPLTSLYATVAAHLKWNCSAELLCSPILVHLTQRKESLKTFAAFNEAPNPEELVVSNCPN